MIDNQGHILHIDFGFFLSNSPGRNMGFETAPFKLLDDFVQVMGGRSSDMFKYFEILVLKGFLASRKHMDRFVTLIDIMSRGAYPAERCLTGGEKGRRTAFETVLGACGCWVALCESTWACGCWVVLRSSVDSTMLFF